MRVGQCRILGILATLAPREGRRRGQRGGLQAPMHNNLQRREVTNLQHRDRAETRVHAAGNSSLCSVVDEFLFARYHLKTLRHEAATAACGRDMCLFIFTHIDEAARGIGQCLGSIAKDAACRIVRQADRQGHRLVHQVPAVAVAISQQ